MKNSFGTDKQKLSILKGKPIKELYYKKGNLGNLLIEAASSEKDNGITFVDEFYNESYLSYKQILEKAYLALGSLQENGVKKGSYVMLIIEENIDFVINFWACVLGGAIPIPLTHPSALTKGNSSVDKILNICESLEKPIIIVDENKKEAYVSLVKSEQMDTVKLLGTNDTRVSKVNGILSLADVNSPAFIQFSSGSTNTPKGVILTHENILVNIESMVNRLKINSEDTIMNWMPFSHDMGLIGFHILEVATVSKIVNISTTTFIKNPGIWLDLVTKYKATVTSSPNFGYKILLQRLNEKQLANWKLNSLRVIINGAEPISEVLVNTFFHKLSSCGLKSSSMNLSYGMAEAALAISISPLNSNPIFHYSDRNKMSKESKIEISMNKKEKTIAVADLGQILDGMELRIVDETGKVITENNIGEIQIKGRNVTSGYLNNGELNKEIFENGWFKTGDMGFVRDGRLSITGRIKDIIFINGQNFYSHDIEDRIESIDGIEPGKIAVCGYHDEVENKEKVVLFSNLIVDAKVYSQVISFVSESIGFNLDYIVIVNKIPKTNSGKVQRFQLMKAFKAKQFVDSTYKASKYLSLDETKAVSKNIGKIKTGINTDSYLEIIKNIWAKVLELPKENINFEKSFLSLGGNSIKAIQMLSYIEDELNIKLSHDILIECHTINEMNDYLLKRPNYIMPNNSNGSSDKNINRSESEDIAVISMAGYFPGAKNLEEFWNDLKKGKSNFTKIPNSRFDIENYYNKDKQSGKTYCDVGGFIDNPYAFDPKFFNISEEEANVMDPQQRIILELVFKVLEEGGYSKAAVDGKNIGMFIGAGTNNYLEYHLNTLKINDIKEFSSFEELSQNQKKQFVEEWNSKFGYTENHPNLLVDNIINMIAARASHEFNFKGPSLTVDTACSSALVTIHLACESLRNKECEMAIAGGVNLLLTPTPYVLFSNAGALSLSGKSKVFDEEADGFVPGEGAGTVLLKPLSKAIDDKDDILAIIKGSAISNDGRSIGVMAPNPDGQRSVIESLYAKKGISPKEIQYVEAHGTGTKIGDPSEVRALSEAYSKWNTEDKSIAIGSVKANVGHLLNAAGIASFIKVVLALKNRTLPPSINVTKPNPLIKFDKTPFYLVNKAKEWTIGKDEKRRAAVNSFGFGGTNCHMILEEAPEIVNYKEIKTNTLPKNVLCLGANNNVALKQKVTNLYEFLKVNGNYLLGDVCYTENLRSMDFKTKCSIVADDINDLIKKLEGLKLKNNEVINFKKIAFMFTGQGSQYVGMAKDIYEVIPEFRAHLDECSEVFYPYIKAKITDLIYSENAENNVLKNTNITQPVVFAIDYSFGKMLMDYGIKPDCVLGHSIGEWAAACIAEVISLKEAARLVSLRGKLMNEIKIQGAMAAVFLSKDKLAELFDKIKPDELWIAAYNGSHQVISGKSQSVDKFINILEKQGIVCKKLKVSEAFHTPLMKSMLAEFEKEMENIKFKEPKIKIVSNITGTFIETPMKLEYWLKHILSSVRFEQSVKFIYDQGITNFIECGPDKILSGMAKAVLINNDVNIMPLLDRKKDNLDVFLGTIGDLNSLGFKFDWAKFFMNFKYNKVKLPLYPFEKSTYGPQFGTLIKKSIAPKEWFYSWKWKEDVKIGEKEIGEGAIIVFADELSIGQQLEYNFDNKTNPVYFVKTGKNFIYDGKNNFVIDPDNRRDYKNVLNEIPNKISTIIHLWTLNHGEFNPKLEILNHKLINENFYSILFMADAIKSKAEESIDFVVVTNRAQKVKQDENISSPYASLATTLTQAIGEDNTEIRCKIIDIDVNAYKTNSDISSTLFNELTIMPNEENIIAIRDNKGFERKLEQLDVIEKSLEIKDGETYLITGGVGPLCGDIALSLAKKAKINLVLTGRSVLPERELWNQTTSDISLKEKISLLMELEKLGAKVMYFSVDVADYDTMKKCIEEVKNKFGHIDGVLHGAGVVDYSEFNLFKKDLNTVNKVLAPKVQGTIITDMLTRNEPLKFFVMLSSVSASKKKWSSGIGDYAAANAFLSSYSIYRNQANAKGKTVAINYSLWEEKGMGKTFGKGAEQAAKVQGLRPLKAEKAVNAFFKAVAFHKINNVHVIDYISEEKAKNTEVKEKVLSYMEIEENKNTIYKIIADELKVSKDNLEIGTNFMELGLDSVGAMKIMANLSAAFKKELYPTLIFEYQTPVALANYIEKNYFTTKKETYVEEEEKDLNEVDKEKTSDIAIIGISLRIPGANNLDEYWKILNDGKVVIKDVPEERWSIRDEYSTEKDSLHTTYSKCGGFIDRAYGFDPLFFGISPKEAEVMDPQQRVFLEVAFEALQEAGYIGKYKTQKIGVFVGSEQNSYMEHFTNYRNYKMLKSSFENSPWFKNMEMDEKRSVLKALINVLKPKELMADSVAGNGLNEIAARVSHCLNLMGPSLVVNTACSSSLVALHLACENLKANQSEIAIVGGVNLNLSSIPFISMSKLNAISPNGECRPFDGDANGMVLSEGVSAIVIKPMKKAMEDGDNIYAVIKGSAINNDGHSQGITAPNPNGQAIAVEMAYKNSGVNPETVSYIEAHGTGTPLGDPIEIQGMTKAFRSFTDKNQFCAISSVKASIGHMLAASGLVSLIKVVLAMKHNTIPKTVNFKNVNPNINFESTPFFVAKENIKWKAKDENPLRAGVNAFGFGGTNAHIVIEESPIIKAEKNDDKIGTHLLQITGKNQNTIKKISENLINYVEQNPEIEISAICDTMNSSQKQLIYKTSVVAESKRDLLDKLYAISEGVMTDEMYNGKINPNKETRCHLLLDGNFKADKNDIQVLKNRFKVFKTAYNTCSSYYESIQVGKTSSEEIDEKVEMFSLEYSFGALLESLQIKFTTIISKGFGILSGAALTGKITINQGINIILDENIDINEKKRAKINSPLITVQGAIDCSDEEDLLYILDLVYDNELFPNLNEIVKEKETILYLGTSKEIEAELEGLSIGAKLINENLANSLEKSFLSALGKMYTLNISYNPKNLYSNYKIIKTALPTYPFDNVDYKMSLENNDYMDYSLQKIDNIIRLSPNDKKNSFAKLSDDFKLNKGL
jgi:acyl transferase domain-containing protein/acyl-CoA synthetase (AMP-forming)/AMP-acid ligase II/acyl carrier protein/NAD(P)-dependent dehydrogenase (short-subunit alcohol dehydrogenase family)